MSLLVGRKNNWLPTDHRTNQKSDGHALMWSRFVATKKAYKANDASSELNGTLAFCMTHEMLQVPSSFDLFSVIFSKINFYKTMTERQTDRLSDGQILS